MCIHILYMVSSRTALLNTCMFCLVFTLYYVARLHGYYPVCPFTLNKPVVLCLLVGVSTEPVTLPTFGLSTWRQPWGPMSFASVG